MYASCTLLFFQQCTCQFVQCTASHNDCSLYYMASLWCKKGIGPSEWLRWFLLVTLSLKDTCYYGCPKLFKTPLSCQVCMIWSSWAYFVSPLVCPQIQHPYNSSLYSSCNVFFLVFSIKFLGCLLACNSSPTMHPLLP